MSDENNPESTPASETKETQNRRFFLRGLGKWSAAAIAAAVTGGCIVATPLAHGGVWVNRRGVVGGGWINGGGGGGWVNRGGGGGWINRRGGGGWINGGGGGWVNRRARGGSWINRF